jgi:hypothetical protein
VHSGDRQFDRFFKTRFASEAIAARIATANQPGQRLKPFMGRYARHVQSVIVTTEGVVCRLDFGSPPYIPEGALNELLPACAELADLLEPQDGSAVREPEAAIERKDVIREVDLLGESEPPEPPEGSVRRDARDVTE